jgi:predicted alpha/beta hydrolase family esterase
METEEEKIIAKPWLETPIDYEKIKNNIPKITAIFSDDDPDVDISDKELFEKYLNAKTLVEHEKGHFSLDVGVLELPVALSSIIDMMEK